MLTRITRAMSALCTVAIADGGDRYYILSLENGKKSVGIASGYWVSRNDSYAVRATMIANY